MSLPFSPQVFAIASQLIEDATGLHFRAADASLLADKLSLRAAELELDSLLDYYYFLRYDPRGPAELDQLIDSLVVNETYFFREADQLRVLASTLIPQTLARHPARGVRIWSAACASGEEPLTLAMLLRDEGLLPRVELVASDISRRALARAQRGVYSGRALRALDAQALAHRFDKAEPTSGTFGSVVKVPGRIASAVQWQRVNLFDFEHVSSLGRFDVILCRNALIYFRDESITLLLEQFARSLVDGGLLLIGASESLLRFATAFECEEHGGAFFYRKVGP